MSGNRHAHSLFRAALVGLPAALLAHALVFGSAHAAGGSLHSVLLDLAGAFSALGIAIVALRARCSPRDIVPGTLPIAAAGALWFGAIEVGEHSHSVPIVVAILALLFAAWIVHAVLSAFAHTVYTIAVLLGTPLVRGQRRVTQRFEPTALHARNHAHVFRLFSRPPPALS